LQVIAETQGRRLLALSTVGVELHLTAQGDTCADPFGLASLGVADRLGEREKFLSAGGWHEEHAIVIAQDQVRTTHRPISHRGGLQRILGTDIEALRAGGNRSQAEDRQPDRSDVSCVAMQSLDHDSRQPSSLSLENHEITDATLIEPSAIVDHQHVARCRPFERIQKNIDAADMSSRRRASGYAATRNYSVHGRGRTAHRDLSANACIRQMGSRQRRKPPPKAVVIHTVFLSLQEPLAQPWARTVE